jgi:hypothetical protein
MFFISQRYVFSMAQRHVFMAPNLQSPSQCSLLRNAMFFMAQRHVFYGA